MKPLCIYHGNCADGFSAAWAVWKKHGNNFDYYPGVYQQEPPEVSGREVYLVDFSYKRPVLEEMARAAKCITVLDHHKSAQEDLASYIDNAKMRMTLDELQGICGLEASLPIRARFDMDKSGAVLAWEYFHPGTHVPKLLLHVQDRDLWRFELPMTREIQASVFSYEYTFENWDMLANSFDSFGHSNLAKEGAAIERKHFKDIKEFSKNAYREVIGGYDVPVVNCPYQWSSDMAGMLSENEPFAACWWKTPGGKTYSLRSREGGIDVSEIAKKYGGGGHKHAAGFSVSD